MTRRLRAGDIVEVLGPDEIHATLDKHGCLGGLPFMPEMLAYTGQRFRVSKRAHKTCDTVHQTGGRRLDDCVHLADLRCDGGAHDGCKASCLLFWKEAWLKRVDSESGETPESAEHGTGLSAILEANTRRTEGDKTVYRCQATALYDATRPLKWWDARQYVEDLTSGNTRPGQMLRVWFFHGLHKLMGLGVGYRIWRRIYDTLQPKVGGFRYPFRGGLVPPGEKTPAETLDLQPGERIRIKDHESIRQTLDQRKCNRGMRFDQEMVPYCGKTYTVARRVDRIIHETSGEMIEIKSPSVILDGVVCRSEMSRCRLFCPRAIPSYWREIWLERVEPAPAQGSMSSTEGIGTRNRPPHSST